VDTIEITKENVVGMLNNTNRPFGHGYTIAAMLLDPNWIS